MKKTKLFLIICFFTLFSIGGATNVNAGDVAFTECSQITLTEKFIETAKVSELVTVGVNKTEAIYITGDDSTVVYCTEKGKPIVTSAGSVEATYSVASTSSGTNMWIARAIAYGYPELASGHSVTTCADRRMATQLLVQLIAKQGANGAWKTYSASTFDSFVTGSRASQVSDAMLEIRNKMLREDSRPSFNGQTIELKYVPNSYYWKASIKDVNSVLNDWKASASGATATISGNTLTIIKKTDSPNSGKVTLSKSAPSGTLYKSTYSTEYQQTVHYKVGKNKTLSASLNYTLEEIGKGIVSVHKIDKYTGKNMQGAKFGIFSDDKCTVKAKDYLGNELQEKATDKNGFVSWDNLYYPLEEDGKRTYYVKETEVIPGYSIDNEQMEMLGADNNSCIPVTVEAERISSSTAEVEYDKNDVEVQAVYNIPYGNITILKQDSETGEVIEGVEFRLLKYNKDRDPATDIYGNEVENAVTGASGVAEFENIPYGDYILEEVKANGSYKILEEPIEFTLDKTTDALKYRDQGTDALPIIGENKGFKYYLGDATGDKKIDEKDKEILEKILAKTDEGVTDKQRYALDVNEDGKLNSTDLEWLEAYIGGETEIFKGLEEHEVEGEYLIPYETYLLGDLTEDGVIDSNDLTIIVGILEGTIKEEEITKVYRYAGDVDLDGEITEKDKELMTAYLGGDPEAFEALKEIEYPGQFQKRVTIVVTNVPIDMKVSKQAITNEKEIKGATIVIKNSEGEVFLKYKSTGKAKEFYIPVGDYTLIEQIAPKGYQNLKTEVEFRVGTDGNIKLISAKSNMYKLIKSEEEQDNDLDHLIIYNNLKKVIVPNTGSTIAFLSIIGGIALIGGGGYAIYRRYKSI